MKPFLFTILLLAQTPLAAEEISRSKSYALSPQSGTASLGFPSVVAKVNGADIPMNLFWNRLMAAAGSTVLTALVDDVLIEQEAEKTLGIKSKGGKKTKVQVKIDGEVDNKIALLKKQFPSEKAFLDQLKASGASLEGLKNQLRLQIYKEKILEDKIKVSPAEVKKYFDDNKDKLAAQKVVWNADTKKGIEQALRQTKFNQEYPKLIQALRAKADIKVFLNQ